MELSTVVGIIIIIVVAVLLMKFLGKIVSLFLSVIGIILVVWLVVAGLRYMDELNIRDNFLESNNLFVLDDGNNLLTGFPTQEGAEPDLSEIEQEVQDPNSELYDEYYKVIVVKKEALPEKTALLVDVADEQDKLNLFKHYVEKNILEGDVADQLIEEEEQGNVEVYKETLAFRHGIKEVLGS